MTRITQHKHKSSEGCKPSDADLDLDTPISEGAAQSQKRGNRQPTADNEGKSADTTQSQTQIHGHRRTNAEECGGKCGAKRTCLSAEPCRGAGRGGYGGRSGVAAWRVGTARGGVARTRGVFHIGDEVRNTSGRGVWGLGTIIGVVPAGKNPRYFCRRKGYPMVFDRMSERVWRERYIVQGDDGRYHVPRKMEAVGDGE